LGFVVGLPVERLHLLNTLRKILGEVLLASNALIFISLFLEKEVGRIPLNLMRS